MNRKIAVVMGSDSDYGKMKPIIPVLKEKGIDYDFRVISAHRTPDIAGEFAQNAKVNGYDLIIAGAGMSAHLAGVLAAFAGVPIIGVPIKSDSSGMDGMDALHSVIQMPPGIPVATVGIDNSAGAAKLAAKMINCGSNLAGKSDAAVKIVYDGNSVGEANLEKVVKALAVYGISYEIADMAKEESLDLCEESNIFAILNLTNINIEEKLKGNKSAENLPVIEVPLKASTNNFNDTSNKIYEQTNAADSVGFVGVNAYQNGAHIAARVLGIHNNGVYEKVVAEHAKLAAAVIEKDAKLRSEVDAEK